MTGVSLAKKSSGARIGAAEPIPMDYPGRLLAHLEVSVVVPTCRRPDLLRACLNALLSQDFDPLRYEIIVCDDGPEAKTQATVAQFTAQFARLSQAGGPTLRYFAVTRTQGPAGARNIGWRAAHAPIIAFTDDDTLPDPGWLTAGVAVFKEGAMAAAGRIVVPLPDHPTDYERDASGLARAEFATANVFVRRSLLAALGGFDERFTSAWREDSDLQFSLLRAGVRIVHAADAIVVHPIRPARWGVSIEQQKKSQFDALLFKKHPELFRQRVRATPPLLYYAILLAALTAVASAIVGPPLLPGAALCAWLILTAWFCIQRLRKTNRRFRHVIEIVSTSILIPFLSIFWRIYGAVKFRVFFL